MPPRVRGAAIVLALAAAVALVLAIRPARGPEAAAPPVRAEAMSPQVTPSSRPLPRLVDLGADRCVPCKAMAPILASLRAQYAGRFDVEFIDVWKDPAAGDPYRIRAIPTQIFFGADGAELYRHEGFYSRDEILATWRRFGYDF